MNNLSKIQKFIFIWAIAWALIATSLAVYPFIKSKIAQQQPRVNLDSDPDRKVELKNHNKLQFIRKFAEQYITTSSSEGTTTYQTALAYLMTDPLREKRLKEIRMWNTNDQLHRNIKQTGKIETILYDLSTDEYYLKIQLIVEEENSEAIATYIELKIQLSEIESSIENPWGLLVSNMQISNQLEKTTEVESNEFYLSNQHPLTLNFPCLVQQIQYDQKQKEFVVLLTSFDVSEIQISPKQALSSTYTLDAFCSDKKFSIQFNPAKQHTHRHTVLRETLSTPMQLKSRSKGLAPYAKTLEKELGFIIED